MRVNERGGYDVVIRRKSDGRYLGGFDTEDPRWFSYPDEAKGHDSDYEALIDAASMGFTDDDAELLPEYELERVPWANEDLMLGDRFYDADENIDYKAIMEYVFGKGRRMEGPDRWTDPDAVVAGMGESEIVTDEDDEDDGNDFYYDPVKGEVIP